MLVAVDNDARAPTNGNPPNCTIDPNIPGDAVISTNEAIAALELEQRLELCRLSKHEKVNETQTLVIGTDRSRRIVKRILYYSNLSFSLLTSENGPFKVAAKNLERRAEGPPR